MHPTEKTFHSEAEMEAIKKTFEKLEAPSDDNRKVLGKWKTISVGLPVMVGEIPCKVRKITKKDIIVRPI